MNVQGKIVEGIKSLLFTNDYIVVPHFGGFVAQSHFSNYLIEKNILTPPGKIISFNKQLKQNDGVLSFWLKNELQISQEQALKHIEEFSDYCNQVLIAKRRLNLEELGFFYLDFENNICFEPKADENYLLESFGLTPLVLNEIIEEEKVVKTNEFVDRRVETETINVASKRRSRYLRPIAYVALGGSILFFALGGLIKLNKNNGPLMAEIFGTSKAAVYKPIEYPKLNIQTSAAEIKPYVSNAEGVAVIELNNKTLAVNIAERENTYVEKSSRHNTSKSYYKSVNGKFQIVLGCFSQEGNAHKMLKKLKKHNITAEISGVNNKGMHVVGCTGFGTKDEAINFLNEIKGNYPNAWIKSEN